MGSTILIPALALRLLVYINLNKVSLYRVFCWALCQNWKVCESWCACRVRLT